MIPLPGQLIILEKGHCIVCQIWITTRNFDKIGTPPRFDFNFVVENANNYTRKYIELIYLIYISMYIQQMIEISIKFRL